MEGDDHGMFSLLSRALTAISRSANTCGSSHLEDLRGRSAARTHARALQTLNPRPPAAPSCRGPEPSTPQAHQAGELVVVSRPLGQPSNPHRSKVVGSSFIGSRCCSMSREGAAQVPTPPDSTFDSLTAGEFLSRSWSTPAQAVDVQLTRTSRTSMRSSTSQQVTLSCTPVTGCPGSVGWSVG